MASSAELDQLSPTGEKFPEKDVDDADLDDLDHLPDVEYTIEEERSLIRKMDIRVVGLVALLYLLSFLDRSSMLGCKCERITLMFYRHRQCEDRRLDDRPETERRPVRMVSLSVLHHIYHISIHVTTVSQESSSA
jgi:hypothetical protein